MQVKPPENHLLYYWIHTWGTYNQSIPRGLHFFPLRMWPTVEIVPRVRCFPPYHPTDQSLIVDKLFLASWAVTWEQNCMILRCGDVRSVNNTWGDRTSSRGALYTCLLCARKQNNYVITLVYMVSVHNRFFQNFYRRCNFVRKKLLSGSKLWKYKSPVLLTLVMQNSFGDFIKFAL